MPIKVTIQPPAKAGGFNIVCHRCQAKIVDKNESRKYNAVHCTKEEWCVVAQDDGVRLERRVYVNVLYDLYGPLLTERQKNVYEMSYFSDWSLSEIAETLGITRQAVHILVNRTVERLFRFEQELGLASRLELLENRIKELESRIGA